MTVRFDPARADERNGYNDALRELGLDGSRPVHVVEIAKKILAKLRVHGRCASCRKIIDGQSETLHPWAADFEGRHGEPDDPDSIVFQCEACSGIPPARTEHWRSELDEAAGRG